MKIPFPRRLNTIFGQTFAGFVAAMLISGALVFALFNDENYLLGAGVLVAEGANFSEKLGIRGVFNQKEEALIAMVYWRRRRRGSLGCRRFWRGFANPLGGTLKITAGSRPNWSR